MKLAAVLACRNQSSRLYAKPLQYLDVKNAVSILDYLIAQLRQHSIISDIVLAISDQEENRIYTKIADRYKIPYVLGDDRDVLGRLIKGAEKVGADHVFRVTTESPYCYLENLNQIFHNHIENEIDYSSTTGLPDGAYFEIIRYRALKKSWDEGEAKHRSELCTLYIFEHQDKFKIIRHSVPEAVQALDVRLTVDWPEDLIVLRKVYEDLKLEPKKPVSIEEIVAYLRENPKINQINNWIGSGKGRVWY